MLATPTTETPAIDRTACPSPDLHGTRWARMDRGCTCVDARRAQYRYNKRYHAGLLPTRHVPIEGTSRRLRALAVLGWSSSQIGARLGCTSQNVLKWRGEKCRTVHVDNAARVAAVCRDLLALPPRTGQAADDARRAARRNRWAPYGAWDDIDDPACLPDLTAIRDHDGAPLTVEDIRFYMSQPGGRHTTDEIGRMYGLDGESVARRLARANRGTPRALTDAQIHELRAEYAADPDRWNLGQAAARYGVSKATVSQLIRGRRRADLELTDLAAHKRGHNPAGTPTPGTNREEDAA